MAFFKVTYDQKHRLATVHNFGCSFRCGVCVYKLNSGAEGAPGLLYPRPERFLRAGEICAALKTVRAKRVEFTGGDPAVARELPEILAFCKRSLRVKTYLAYTNGSRLPMEHLDGANVGLKAWDEKVHMAYTGSKKWPVFSSFAECVRVRMEMKANVTLVPGLVDVDQVEAIARWLAELGKQIPLRVMGYVPVPGQMYRRATDEQLERAVGACRQYLENVDASWAATEEERDGMQWASGKGVRQLA